jgi:thiol-disulfide isomerase/thioredoxin
LKQVVAIVSAVMLRAALAYGQPDDIVPAVRAAIGAGDFAAAESLVAASRTRSGVTPANLEAQSWLGRGALAAGRLEAADRYARETHTLALHALKTRGVDDEPRLPIALGAAIEVQAQAAAARGERSLAVQFLRQELRTYETTSLYKRIQKNINLLSLHGEMPPALDLSEYLGPAPPPLEQLRGQVVLLFFWAHWCPDCKLQGPILSDLLKRYGSQGLTIVAPTQRFGYAERGRAIGPDEELAYIAKVRDEHYAFLVNRPVPTSETNHKTYGVSSTPTIVLLGRDGRVALYRPGRIERGELESTIRGLLERSPAPAH